MILNVDQMEVFLKSQILLPRRPRRCVLVRRNDFIFHASRAHSSTGKCCNRCWRLLWMLLLMNVTAVLSLCSNSQQHVRAELPSRRREQWFQTQLSDGPDEGAAVHPRPRGPGETSSTRTESEAQTKRWKPLRRWIGAKVSRLAVLVPYTALKTYS